MTVTTAPPVAGEQASPTPATPDGAGAGRRRLFAALPVVLLVGISAVVFAGAALITGHPLLIGDNLIQSYPLRVLVGNDLRAGQLPLWDPWIWSGTPLMAGLNAGAFYPATLLFAVLPPAAAWVIGQILVWSSISVGTFAFLRATGTGRLPAFLGAASFAFAGAVAGQGAVHMDMAEGFASLPWMLLAIRRIIDDGRWRWSVLLGVAFACLLLAGAPEAMLDVTILCLTYTVMRWSLRPAAWGRLVSRAGGGFAIGLGLSAVVWVPALAFIAISQRAVVTSAFVSSYSFPPRALLLGVAPFLDGGWGLLSQPPYFGPSNLPEVSFYVGLLPVVAAIALAGRRWKEWLPKGERRTWYVVGLVGLVLAVGAGTPLEHVIARIPFYGRQRDQGRNIVDVDFAACVLLAWWVDGGRRPDGARSASERIAAAGISALLLAGLGWLLVAPSSLWTTLGAVTPSTAQLASIRLGVGISLVLALLAGGLVSARRHLSRARFRQLATVFVLVDVALFASGTSFAMSQSVPTAARPGPLLRLVKANLSPSGRYAVYDPDLFYPTALAAAGESNVGILVHLASVQGYGAILGAKYARYTATHGRSYVALGELQRGYFRPLGLQVMLAPPEEFLIPISAMPSPGHLALTPVVEGAGVDPALPAGNSTPPQDHLPQLEPSGPRPPIAAGNRTGWFFGTVLSPGRATLVVAGGFAGQLVRVGRITPSGALSWQPPQRLPQDGRTAVLDVPVAPSAGLVLQLVSGAGLGRMQLTVKAGDRAYLVDGPLPNALTPASWTYVGQADHFAVFRTSYSPEQAWVQRLGTDAIASHVPAEVDVLSQSTDGVTIAVRSPRRSILLRNSAWDNGWRADVVSGTAAVRDLPAVRAGSRRLAGSSAAAVRQVGVLQGVDIPKGLSLVQFSYRAKGLSKGLALSGVTVGVVGAGFVVVIVLGRRKRRLQATPDPVSSGGGGR